MEDSQNNSNILKRIDIYENKEEIPPLQTERKNFIQNKMMKFYKLISNKDDKENQILFMSDNKGIVYMYEFMEDNKPPKILNLNSICNDSKYILVDIIKSSKYHYYISLNLNPCINIFKFKNSSQNDNKEIEVLQHINLKNNNKSLKYYKIYECNIRNKDYLILLSENKIELWLNNNNNNKDIVNYERIYSLLYENSENENEESKDNANKISNIYKINEENLVLFEKNKLEFIYLKISEIKGKKVIIEIENKIKINGIKPQFENINSLFIDKNYIFLGLCDSLILVSVPYGEIIQTYKFGKVLLMKKINEEKDTIIFAETNLKEYFFIKFKYEEGIGFKEIKRVKYDYWVYKFDIIQKVLNEDIIAVYDIKGFITLLKC